MNEEQIAAVREVLTDSLNGVEPRQPDVELEPGWPAPMRREAFRGLAGDFVALVEPHTEADRHGLLLQLLAACGNLVGRTAGVMADGAFHAPVVWPALIGASAKARKGTSWSRVRQLLEQVDPAWTTDNFEGGLSTGEGLAWRIRDERRERRRAKKGETGDDDGMVEVLVDPGVTDKRLMVVETEFAQIFKTLAREGNTLSIALRTLWDFGQASGLTKKDPTRVTGGHVTVVGHCTVDELRSVVSDVDLAGGLVNRFVFACVRRSKELPEGGYVPPDRLEELAYHLRTVIQGAAQISEPLERTKQARELWQVLYHRLTADVPGRLGQATARAEAQVLRLSLIYALLAGQDRIDVEHLEAAHAVWDYCAASAAYVFGAGTGDTLADKILAALRDAPAGLTRTDIRDLVGGRETEERIEVALNRLRRYGLARMDVETTGGRPAERWFQVDETEPR